MPSFRTLTTAVIASAFGVLAFTAGPIAAQAVDAGTATTASASSALCPRVPGRIWCLAERAPISTGSTASSGQMRAFTATPSTDSPYSPSDLRSAYAIPSSTVTTTVAIVDAYDAPNVESDLAAYRSTYGLPACTTANGCFTKVNQNGAAAPLPAANSDWVGETTLDVEMVSAVCPTCHILLVEAADDDRSGQPSLETAVATAARLGAKYVSMSWGSGEYSGEQSQDATYFSAPGVTYVAASGDGDYATSWPAVSPNVVAVGGTTLLRNASTARGWTESVWSDGSGGGTGSGCSSYEPRPSWQNSSVITSVCAGRAMNDLSIIADPDPGVMVYQGGSWWRYGGTSAGAPMIAAMEAIAGTTGDAVSYPYTHAAAFNDVTSGSNGSCGNALCRAGSGWDGPTGVGTPIGVAGLSAQGALVGSAPTGGSAGAAGGSGSGSTPGSTSGSGTTSGSGSSTTTRQNDPPKISVHNPGRVTTTAGHAVRLNVAAVDRAGLAVEYRASGLPAGTRLTTSGSIVGRPHRAGRNHVRVTATDSAGSSASIAFTWQVRAHRIVPRSTPHVAGTARRGQTLHAAWGTLRADSRRGAVIHPRVHVQWYVAGHAIKGATHRVLHVAACYRGKRITFRLTAVQPNFARYARMSLSTSRVR
jgi:hypothetical protein